MKGYKFVNINLEAKKFSSGVWTHVMSFQILRWQNGKCGDDDNDEKGDFEWCIPGLKCRVRVKFQCLDKVASCQGALQWSEIKLSDQTACKTLFLRLTY